MTCEDCGEEDVECLCPLDVLRGRVIRLRDEHDKLLRDRNGGDVMLCQTIRSNDTGSITWIDIPPGLAQPIDVGCDCEYCKAHPNEIPSWDTLVVDPFALHTRTIHNPLRRNPR